MLKIDPHKRTLVSGRPFQLLNQRLVSFPIPLRTQNKQALLSVVGRKPGNTDRFLGPRSPFATLARRRRGAGRTSFILLQDIGDKRGFLVLEFDNVQVHALLLNVEQHHHLPDSFEVLFAAGIPHGAVARVRGQNERLRGGFALAPGAASQHRKNGCCHFGGAGKLQLDANRSDFSLDVDELDETANTSEFLLIRHQDDDGFAGRMRQERRTVDADGRHLAGRFSRGPRGPLGGSSHAG